MSAKKETRDLLRAAQRQGFEVERTRRSGHFKITPPNPGASVVSPLAPRATTPRTSCCVRGCAEPGSWDEEVPMSLLRETRLRKLIREHARTQEGYDARLYDLWDEWNEKYFEGRMVPPLIQLTQPQTTHRYGDCCPYSGLAGIRSLIRLRPSILDGTCLELKHGSRNPEGCRRFLEDVLLHEMIHQHHQEITGERDGSYFGHGPAFAAKANEIGAKLGLSPVGRTCKKRDHKDKGLASPSQWPHDVRPDASWKGD